MADRKLITSQFDNPFISMGNKWRIAILAYIVLYNMVNPAISELLIQSPPLALPRLTIQIILQFLLFFPLFFYRKNYGWLHPLIFPVIFSLLIGFGKDPFTLIQFFSFSGAETFSHPALVGWSDYEIAKVYIRADLIKIASLLFYYAGFFVTFDFKVPDLSFKQPSRLPFKSIVFVGISVVLFAYFLISQGGLEKLILSFAGGRFRNLEGTGHIRALITSLSLVGVLVWYAFDTKVFQNPLFWGAFVFTISNGFLTSGSRASIFYTLTLFLMIWMLRHRKVPAGRTMIIAVIGFLFIGVLGELRTAGNQADQLDWSILTGDSLTERIESTNKNIGARSNGYIAVVGKGIEEEGLLWGRTYLGAVFFWVPRTIWSSKPRGAGAYTGNLLFRGGSLEQNPLGGEGGGVPPGGVGEAYWNFWIPGVLLIYFLFGVLMKWLANLLRKYPKEPTVWVLYVMILFYIDPSTISLVSLAQSLAVLCVFLYWTGAVGFRTIKTSVYEPA